MANIGQKETKENIYGRIVKVAVFKNE